MRVAGVLAPVSRRYAVIDSIAALPVPTVPARIGNQEREPAPVDEAADSVRLDTVGSTPDGDADPVPAADLDGVPAADTLVVAFADTASAADTLAVAAADTIRR
jgi:hypothetical protein